MLVRTAFLAAARLGASPGGAARGPRSVLVALRAAPMGLLNSEPFRARPHAQAAAALHGRNAAPLRGRALEGPVAVRPSVAEHKKPAQAMCSSAAQAETAKASFGSNQPPIVGLPRWPDSTPTGILRALDYSGTVAFAFTGSITAASVGMDLCGCMVLGTITAVGGGTIRDAIVLHKRPFWSDGEYEYLLISLVAAAAAFFLWPTLAEMGMTEDDFLIWFLDAAGVGAFCVIGAKNGIRAGMHPAISVLCGIMTATFGGMVRDTLAQRPVRILHSHAEIYATTAGGGATAFMLARAAGAPLWLRLNVGFWVAVAMRYVAWTSKVGLPTWEGMGAGHLVVRKRA